MDPATLQRRAPMAAKTKHRAWSLHARLAPSAPAERPPWQHEAPPVTQPLLDPPTAARRRRRPRRCRKALPLPASISPASQSGTVPEMRGVVSVGLSLVRAVAATAATIPKQGVLGRARGLQRQPPSCWVVVTPWRGHVAPDCVGRLGQRHHPKAECCSESHHLLCVASPHGEATWRRKR
jgi:hypothetical protein